MIEEIVQETAIGNTHLWPFVKAETKYHFTSFQQSTFSTLEQTLICLKDNGDSDNLPVNIGKTADDEIFISRKSADGVSNLLIYEDGTMAHSFIFYKNSSRQDFLHFFDSVDTIDYKQLLLQFFSF